MINDPLAPANCRRLKFALIAAGVLCCVGPGAAMAQGEPPADKPEAKPAAKPAADQSVEWLGGLAAGYREAQTKQRPIIVRVGGDACPACEILAAEIAKPDVQKELKNWTLVYVDVDESPADARLMAVGPIPALRILTSQGKVVASQDGALPAEELLAWLKEHREAAAAEVSSELLTRTGPPTVLDVVRLVRQFQTRDAAIREAAVRRLKPYPHTAANAVVGAMTEGNLSTRLMALELLQQWEAPVEGVDPWQPETITDERVDQLSAWASSLEPDAEAEAEDTPPPVELSEGDWRSVRETIDKMITADAAEARAMRERLARFGAALLPEVYQRLKEAETDAARRRLTALRYRLVASDELVLKWPGGLESLAANDEATRMAAADELSRRATGRDEALLLELFSDPAPLIREISLRTLQSVGGRDTDQALIRLLEDPEPNVRAAVLKQLTESPSRRLVPEIAKYVESEKNADLVVHAVRFLREAGGEEAVASLKSLSKDPSWQVRAEAAEAIGDIADNGRGVNDAETAKAYRVLIDMLHDEDPFVVSRAIKGLGESDLSSAVQPMVDAAEKHPDLAAEIVRIIAKTNNDDTAGIAHLRKFFKHGQAKVRAAAIAGLMTQESDQVAEELTAALSDSAAEVRIAAAKGLFQRLEQFRNHHKYEATFAGDDVWVDVEVEPAPSFLGGLVDQLFGGGPKPRNIEVEPEAEVAEPLLVPDVVELDKAVPDPETPKETPQVTSEEVPADPTDEGAESTEESVKGVDVEGDESGDKDKRLREIRAGKHLPEWTFASTDLLVPMLAGESVEERMAAAMALAAVGKGDENAVPVLRTIAAEHPEHVSHIASVLPWLLWEDRRELFKTLVTTAGDSSDLARISYAIAESDDDRNAELLWSLLNHDEATSQTLSSIEYSVRELYYGNDSYDPTSAPPQRQKLVRENVTPLAKTGTRWQRIMALALLLPIAPDDVIAIAQQIVDDTTAEAGFRADAFQVLLVANGNENAEALAIGALTHDVADIQKLAIRYLAFGGPAVASLHDGALILDHQLRFSSFRYNASGGEIIKIKSPNALKLEDIRPLLASDDADVAAGAAYLAVLLGEEGALDRLIEEWKKTNDAEVKLSQPDRRLRLRRLMYRAIAFENDAERLDVLTEIYEELHEEDDGLGEFYWTIRSMTGPQMLTFRKRIRDEVGMENLR